MPLSNSSDHIMRNLLNNFRTTVAINRNGNHSRREGKDGLGRRVLLSGTNEIQKIDEDSQKSGSWRRRSKE